MESVDKVTSVSANLIRDGRLAVRLRETDEAFRPTVVDHLRTRTADLETLVRGMYVRGLSTRDVSALCHDTLGASRLNKRTVSRVTQQLNQGVLSLAHAGQSVLDSPYFRQVFVAPPWEEIYTTDNERDQRFPESVRVHRCASDWYRALGFELIELPRVSVEQRCDFVLQRLRVS